MANLAQRCREIRAAAVAGWCIAAVLLLLLAGSAGRASAGTEVLVEPPASLASGGGAVYSPPAEAVLPEPLQPLPADAPLLSMPEPQPFEIPGQAPFEMQDQQPFVMPEQHPLETPLDGPIVSLAPDEPRSRGGRAGEGPAGYLLESGLYSYAPISGRIVWLPAGGDELGIVSLENLATLSAEARSGVVGGFGFHFLDGPVQTEMPPRLYDFSIGYQRREWIRPNLGWDFVFRVGAFSDFEGSAKEGVRFPSHAVALLRLTPTVTWLLGVDYLDRDDISLLPVFGAVWAPAEDLRFDLAFPRPRAAVKIMDTTSWLYVAGELGGGTWAIERGTSADDNATYRDVRLTFGIETLHDGGPSSALELGYVFARELQYRSGVGDYSPRDCLMIAIVSRY